MYTSQAEMEAALTAELVLQAADDGQGQVDPAVVADVGARASATVDSYLSNRYPVPLAPAPATVRVHTTHIAAYLLLSRRGFVETEDAPVAKLYRDALAWLRDVAAGKAHIPGLDGGPPTPPRGIGWRSREQVFGPDTLDKY